MEREQRRLNNELLKQEQTSDNDISMQDSPRIGESLIKKEVKHESGKIKILANRKALNKYKN